MPAPAFVRPPPPLIPMVLTVVLPAPVKVSRLPPLLMPPVSVRPSPLNGRYASRSWRRRRA